MTNKEYEMLSYNTKKKLLGIGGTYNFTAKSDLIKFISKFKFIKDGKFIK